MFVLSVLILYNPLITNLDYYRLSSGDELKVHFYPFDVNVNIDV